MPCGRGCRACPPRTAARRCGRTRGLPSGAFISWLIGARASDKATQTYGGHGSYAFTADRYGHTFQHDLGETAERLQAYLDGHRAA
jgi:hypothetical protein